MLLFFWTVGFVLTVVENFTSFQVSSIELVNMGDVKMEESCMARWLGEVGI